MSSINKIESKLGIAFEESFLNIIRNNEEEKYLEREISYFDPVKKKEFSTSMSTFLDPQLADNGGIILENSYYAPEYLINKRIIPFACDAGGYFFCFNYSNGQKTPSIVLWIRDNPEGLDIGEISTNFHDFINNLKDESSCID